MFDSSQLLLRFTTISFSFCIATEEICSVVVWQDFGLSLCCINHNNRWMIIWTIYDTFGTEVHKPITGYTGYAHFMAMNICNVQTSTFQVFWISGMIDQILFWRHSLQLMKTSRLCRNTQSYKITEVVTDARHNCFSLWLQKVWYVHEN